MSNSHLLNLLKDTENLLKKTPMKKPEDNQKDIFDVEWQVGSNNVDFGVLTKKGALVVGHCTQEIAEHIVKVHNEYRQANKTSSRGKARSKNAKR